MPRVARRKRAAEDFQMAPMIDMVFLLLVFFMCVSSLAEADKSIELDLALSDESKVPEDLAGRGKVSVDAGGRIFINAQEVTLEEMKTTVGETLAGNPALKVLVRADRATPFAKIKRVLRACAEIGAYEVIYATEQTGAGP